jgi:hypothetical protein
MNTFKRYHLLSRWSWYFFTEASSSLRMPVNFLKMGGMSSGSFLEAAQKQAKKVKEH